MKNINKKDFIELFNKKYNGAYECRINDDKNTISPTDKICVICPKHGLFIETAYDLLNGVKCFKCFEEERGD